MTETFAFTKENKTRYDNYLTRYDDVESALLPVLHLAQEQNGWLSESVVNTVSEMMTIPHIKIKEVISFYDMFYDHPTAENIIQVCTNISCSMNGGRKLHKDLLDHFKTNNMQPTKDGKVYIQKMECLGACEMAPCMRINNDYAGPITFESAVKKIKELS